MDNLVTKTIYVSFNETISEHPRFIKVVEALEAWLNDYTTRGKTPTGFFEYYKQNYDQKRV